MFISLCLLAFAVRLYIRYHCFRKLLTDDYIMMFSFVLLAAVAGTGQAYIKDIYYVVDLENGRQLPDATTPKRMQDGLRSFGAEMIMSVIGITAVKINFLFFFKRLGTQITSYLVFWWICLVIVVGCGAVNLGLLDYKCVYADLQYTFMHCTQRSTLKRYFNFQKVSVSLDVVSDVFSKSH